MRGHGVTQTTDKELDPEMVCTRVMARLIEDIGCVAIAPDSPAWSDLGQHGPARAGELRVYRGRGRVQKIVSSCLSVPPSAHSHGGKIREPVPRAADSVDSHSLFVLTQPESPVPHLLLDIARRGERVSVHVDLLPKRDLAVSQDYLERCYEPLSAVRAQIDQEASFTPGQLSLRQRAMLSPWGALFSLAPADLPTAEPIVARYLAHWAALLRSDAAELTERPELATRDLRQRRLLFTRAMDPNWDLLDRTIGIPSVDRILAALTD